MMNNYRRNASLWRNRTIQSRQRGADRNASKIRLEMSGKGSLAGAIGHCQCPAPLTKARNWPRKSMKAVLLCSNRPTSELENAHSWQRIFGQEDNLIHSLPSNGQCKRQAHSWFSRDTRKLEIGFQSIPKHANLMQICHMSMSECHGIG
jgi:hypothetical protein